MVIVYSSLSAVKYSDYKQINDASCQGAHSGLWYAGTWSILTGAHGYVYCVIIILHSTWWKDARYALCALFKIFKNNDPSNFRVLVRALLDAGDNQKQMCLILPVSTKDSLKTTYCP